jgi:alpha-ketoglutarate-dependent taurine dioxygenase
VNASPAELAGRTALRIDGVSPERSDRLLAEIFTLAEEPRFHYRHQWLPSPVARQRLGDLGQSLP